MPAEVVLQLRDARWKSTLRPYGKTVRDACALALEHTRFARRDTELCVVLADDAFVQELNYQYRGKKKPTNVLSFPAEEGQPAGQPVNLGDIVLALDTLRREAGEQGKSPRRHALHLLVHGVLHLAGYDHEDEKQAARMEALEIKILEKLKVENPYL